MRYSITLGLIVGKTMFSLLSNKQRIFEQLSAFNSQDLTTAAENLTFVITSLKIEVSELLANRQKHGVLLPDENRKTDKPQFKDLTLPQILLNHEELTATINTLCLTEAIIVRDSLSNCLTDLEEQGKLSLTSLCHEKDTYITPLNKESDKQAQKTSEKSNVSPIRLTQIKQRLALATKETSTKQTQIKEKLNALLTPKLEISEINKRA